LAEAALAVEGVSAAFNREAVTARAGSEPDWLTERRLAAWDAYEATPMPTTRLEEWRYTDPKRLRWADVALPAEPPAGDDRGAHDILDGRPAAATVFVTNGRVREVNLSDNLAAKGVILADLATAAVEHEALVREHLGTRATTPEEGKFAALNGALWSGGVFLYLPKGVRVEHPIRVIRWVDAGGQAYLPRTLIVAEQGSHVAFVEEFASPDFDKASPVFSCGAVEILAGPASEVQYVSLQHWGDHVHHMATHRTIAERDANLDTLVVNLGGRVARVDLAASMEGPGSRSDMLGLYFGRGEQHFDHNTRQNHRVPHATSDLLYKGALDDRAHAVFRGIIKVYPKAQRTDAYQTNRNLLLSRSCQATALPNLEIEADDVRCSHAATVGQLDADELFYIMSRGIARREAERLVVFGFFGEVLDRLPMEGVTEELRDAIARKIG